MEPRLDNRAPRISGLNAAGEPVDLDYSTHLMNVVVFFEPVSMHSLDIVEQMRLMSVRYENLSVGFWYVMEPRLSCILHHDVAQKTLDRISLFSNTLFDANNMIALYAGIRTVPTVLIADSNGFLVSRYEGEVSSMEIERNLQARIALSGYRDELPVMQKPERAVVSLRSGSVMRQMGYANGDYVFSNMVVPETDQDFRLPDFYLLNTIYPFSAWFVGRDFIEGKNGSTLYISCGRDETVYVFAGAEKGTIVRMHTSIESPQHLSLGKDIKSDGRMMQLEVDEFRPYEILSSTGDADVLVSLQIVTGSFRLFSVEFCPAQALVRAEHAFRQARQ